MSILDNAKGVADAVHEIKNLELYGRRVLNLHSDIVALVEENIRLRDENKELKDALRFKGEMKFEKPNAGLSVIIASFNRLSITATEADALERENARLSREVNHEETMAAAGDCCSASVHPCPGSASRAHGRTVPI